MLSPPTARLNVGSAGLGCSAATGRLWRRGRGSCVSFSPLSAKEQRLQGDFIDCGGKFLGNLGNKLRGHFLRANFRRIKKKKKTTTDKIYKSNWCRSLAEVWDNGDAAKRTTS